MHKSQALVLIFPASILVLPVLRIYAAAEPASPPTHLRCEYLDNPVGIDTPHPRFFWWIEQDGRGASQSAYQILVATSPAILSQNRGDQWDSGKTNSPDTIQVAYAGKPLQTGKDYYWKIRYWDNNGNPSPYSAVARFSMGIMSPQEWKGSWIGGGPTRGNEFRKAFTLDGTIKRAQVCVTALGYYELRMNGKRIGRKVLDPAWTTYPKRVLYSTYDVTGDLQNGPNAIGVMLGGGWATLAARKIPPYYKSPALLLDMQIEMADGKIVTIATDGSWKTIRGPVLEDSVYNGEVYDARRETPGWDTPGFDDSRWAPAAVVQGSDGIRSAEMMPAIKVVDSIVPKKVTNPEPGVYVFDMGQNISGWAQLKVRGPAGARVTMRFAEVVYKDGMINRQNLMSAKSRDIYVLKGHGLETYQPRFTYHGFRYVEVTGYPGTPSINSLRGKVVHTAVTPTGSFLASRQILNNIQDAILWSQQTNLFGVPTDCDQRDERQGWMGDAQITSKEAMMNFDMAAFYTNFLRDMRDAQAPDGSLPPTVPHKYGPLHSDLGWQSAFPIITWYMWTHYADRRILQKDEPGIKRYVDFLQHDAKDNVLQDPYGPWGDWVAVENTPLNYLGDIWYYYDVELLSKIETALGNSAEAENYSHLAGQIHDAFNRTFFHADTGEYANGSQTANAMALYMGMPSSEDRSRVVTNLTNDITYYHNTHTTSGFVGIRYLMPVLTKFGRSDLAYELAVQDTYPSWGYMLKHGATTLWELWQDKTGPSMNSHDHIMFGSVGAWFYQALAGIDQDAGSAGYRHIRIEPHVVEDLKWASATVQTVRGPVSSSWTHTPSSLALNASIPVGSDGQVQIAFPSDFTSERVTESGRVIWENGHFVPGDSGVSGAKQQGNSLLFDVASGNYAFQLNGQ
ncbi:MAG TPA: family 78 glycoside hydrolase catalytic domain [Terracidiphilus sp.]|nr:family 78 glycoside hydrolase catalytic domain [Terracidiphilus sp.]